MKKALCIILSVAMMLVYFSSFQTFASADCIVIDTFDSVEGILSNSNRGTVDSSNYKEGNGSVSTYGNTNIYLMHQDTGYNVTLPDDIKDYYLQMWIYIDDVSAVKAGSCLELSQAIDSVEMQWSVPDLGLQNGWNRLYLPLNNISSNMTKAEYLRVFLFLEDGKEVVLKLDDLCLVKSVDNADYIVVDTFDSAAGILSNNNHGTVDTVNRKQGNGSLSTYGHTNIYLMYTDSKYNIVLPPDIKDYYLQMWLYIDDISAVKAGSCLELSQIVDSNELQWSIPDLGLQNGWNKLLLPLNIISPNMTRADYLRVFLFLEDGKEVVMKLDDLCLVKNINPTDFSVLEEAIAKAKQVPKEDIEKMGGAVVNEFNQALAAAENTSGYTSRDVDVAADNLLRVVEKIEKQANLVPVSEVNITTYGRTYYQDGNYHFNWTHSGFSFYFKGEQVSANFKISGTVYLDVYIDGATTPAKTIILGASSEKVLAENLTDKFHEIKVLKRSENGWGGTAAVESIAYVKGQLSSKTPPRPMRNIEVIGDSITAGFGNLVSDGSINTYRVQDQNGNKTYAIMGCAPFNANMTVMAKSGIGFAYNNGGSTTDTMYDAYTYTDYFGYNKTTKWDFANNKRDLVIIGLGTNDTCAPSATAYYEGAKRLLALVREKNPNATILWVYEIMTNGYADQIKRAVNEAKTAGDNKVFYHTLGLINEPVEGMGGAGHPSMATHTRAAEGLSQCISEIMGWELNSTKAPDYVETTPDSALLVNGQNLIAHTDYVGMSVKEFKNEFMHSEFIAVVNKDGSVANDADPISTEMQIGIKDGANLKLYKTLVLLGDVDGNGRLISSDALMALQYAVEKIQLNDIQTIAASVDGDTEVTAVDALKILQYSVGKIDSFK